MARKSKLKSELKTHNSTIKEKNELASKVLTDENSTNTGDNEVGIIDDLKKKIMGEPKEEEQASAAKLEEEKLKAEAIKKEKELAEKAAEEKEKKAEVARQKAEAEAA